MRLRIFSKKMLAKKILAYSLLEVAIAIMVSGVAISSIIPLLKTISISKKMRLNEEKYHYIRYAMQGYLLRYGYLPFAAKNDGMELTNMVRGFVPYKTLGITKEYIYDSNGNLFTYIVNKNLAKQANKEYIPITRPVHSIMNKNQVTFCRLYKHDKTLMMDEICTLENLVILEKGVSIIEPKDMFYIMEPMYFFKNANDWNEWQVKAFSSKLLRQKSCNVVAWAIISHGPNKNNRPITKCKEMNNNETQKICILPESGDNGLFNDVIFYQTRFDMAAQSGWPCTSESIIVRNS